MRQKFCHAEKLWPTSLYPNLTIVVFLAHFLSKFSSWAQKCSGGAAAFFAREVFEVDFFDFLKVLRYFRRATIDFSTKNGFLDFYLKIPILGSEIDGSEMRPKVRFWILAGLSKIFKKS